MNAKEQYISFMTIFTWEVTRFMRIWKQTILPSVVTTVLYLVIFGNLIGSRIGEMHDVNYIQFIIPGLIMLAVLTNSYSNVVSSFYGNKFQKNIEELLVSPTPNHIIILGFVLGGVARGLVVGFFVTLSCLFFTTFPTYNLLISLLIIFLTALLSSFMGLINGIFAKSFDDMSIIPTFVLTPLTYLGGIFYSIDLLPEFWQNVSLINPILYMVNAFRYGFLGFSDIPLWIAFTMIIGFSIILYAISSYLINKGYGIRN